MTRYEFCIKGRPMLDEPYHFKEVGLPNVYLLSGVTIEDDADYGRIVTVEKLSDLHRAIGLRIVAKSGPMTGDEMRFLRKEMEMTQTNLAKLLRVNHQTVANYEKGKTERGAADTAMRFLYLSHEAPTEHLAEMCKQFAETLVAPKVKISATIRRKFSGRWTEADCIAA